ncbi:anti-sigma regulatory factor (Ser/Thr protein kinase) [Actinomadura coerulea]|uniref:Anti-sigma regulatory factor (Ser/Thr protein kinase) n=1 Tax=Actinomadura coerulea TaxID=46159 RepID=A0A7X0G1B4_9ACTN|nr:anti-sigma regulatory factor (Ser/Thr protein kinase) [Actinomadura coerulea]GGP95578.1 TorS-related protein [Actinomadura coerulea]
MDPLTGTGWMTSPPAGDAVWLRAEEPSAAAGARRQAARLAERLGFAGERLGQIQLAVTEAATNLAKHAVQGEILVRIVRVGEEAALELVCMDRGPGIPDVRASRMDGHTTSGTLGLGLGSIERLADRTGMHSLPGTGTVLFAGFSRPGGDAAPVDRPGPPFAGLTRPIDGEEECGDAYAARLDGGTVYAMVCDGLGHGPMAARAGREAVMAMREAVLPARPLDLLRQVHQRLAATRGGAVAVAAVDPAAGTVRFAGLGNVAGWIVGPDRRHGMISVPGIAGAKTRTLREHAYDLPEGAAVVLHSDGLTDKWGAAGRPGPAREPLLIAADLLRSAGVRHDDRCVLAVTTAGRR